MKLDDFLSTVADSCKKQGPEQTIVLSSRVRIARNVKGYSFPGWAKKQERIRLFENVRPVIESLDEMKSSFSDSMDNLSSLEKQILVERHLISREHAARNSGSGLVLNKDESLCVMINEEDHLRMQLIQPGLQLDAAWKQLDEIDTRLEESLPYAFSRTLGYLTACPTNVGTAIRVSAMLHLPGLVLADQINQVVQAVSKLGMAVRGLYGEGTDALGNIFQVSNQMTLGESEKDIIDRLNKVLKQMIEHEENARASMVEKKPKIVLNQVGRAYGILSNAHSITSKETMNLLSMMRLGNDFGLFSKMRRSLVEELFISTQPAHLQKNVQDKLSAEQRDLIRADFLRGKLRSVSRPSDKFAEVSSADGDDSDPNI
ncbi:MAG: protein arginine kinase [Verrucomicrobia bacterium]|nr:protein arginine kinase [Verrucomicrobiota bacterium]